jgi:hypothetical protein
VFGILSGNFYEVSRVSNSIQESLRREACLEFDPGISETCDVFGILSGNLRDVSLVGIRSGKL